MFKKELTAFALVVTMLGMATTPVLAANCRSDFPGFWIDQSYELPAGYWSEGQHSYDMTLSSLDSGPETFHIEFTVSGSAALLDGQVFLRFTGLRSESGSVTEIHPDQDTLFQVSWYLGPDRDEAEASAAGITSTVSWDGGDPITLVSGPIINSCGSLNPGRFLRQWGPLSVD